MSSELRCSGSATISMAVIRVPVTVMSSTSAARPGGVLRMPMRPSMSAVRAYLARSAKARAPRATAVAPRTASGRCVGATVASTWSTTSGSRTVSRSSKSPLRAAARKASTMRLRRA